MPLIELANWGSHLALDKCVELFMLPIKPIIIDFPFMGIKPCVDIYSIFGKKPIHLLSMGISKMLKSCASEMMKNDSQSSSSFRTARGIHRTVLVLRRKVFHIHNSLLKENEQNSVGFSIRIHYFKG